MITLLIFSITPVIYAGQINVKSSVSIVNKKYISLKDIVEFKNVSARLVKDIGDIKLSDAPAKGERKIFTNRAISKILRKKLKGKGVKFKIPKYITVESPVYTITRNSVKAKLIGFWKTLCDECEFNITQINMPTIPAQYKSNNWSLPEGGQLPKGSFNQHLRVENGSQNVNFWITGQVKVLKIVPVLKRTLFVGQKIQPGDFEYKKREVTFLQNRVNPDKNQIVGKRVRRGLRSGEIIWLDSLERSKALRRGDVVTVVSSNSSWSIAIKAVAQQDGFVGDLVRLLNQVSNKIIMGKVISENLVELQ